MLTIQNFRSHFREIVLARGERYAREGRVTHIERFWDGRISATVEGTDDYHVDFQLTEKGAIKDALCDCPYGYDGYCKHLAAVLLVLENEFKADGSFRFPAEGKKKARISTSEGIKDLMQRLGVQSESDVAENDDKVRIVPSLISSPMLKLELKIGRDKLYSVQNIQKLYLNFQFGFTQKYGKELEFRHSFNLLDDKSRQLLDFSIFALQVAPNYASTDKSIVLTDSKLDSFFSRICEDSVLLDGQMCPVIRENPKVVFAFHKSSDGRFSVTFDETFKLLGVGSRSTCLYDGQANKIYLADRAFTETASPLMEYLSSGRDGYISAEDMPTFYTLVVKPMQKFAIFGGVDELESMIPPDMTPQLYLDCGSEKEVLANLTFTYGEDIIQAFDKGQSNAKHFDPIGERKIKNLVLRYFSENPLDPAHPLKMTDSADIYNFLTDGLPELSKQMEIYASERFERLRVRPPVKTAVGIRPSGKLLELSISDGNYIPEELIALLGAYRKGEKYHRLQDGSFARIDESVAELAELAENLNLKDRDFLKKHIDIPKYRMLYLESLEGGKNVRLRESEEFRKTVRSYREELENSESGNVPKSLQNILREYQKSGFRWMRTVSAYGFGGILADDMGLGKTIQAIALLLDEKQKSGGKSCSLIVCPSSLTLNWLAEIDKFAPELRAIAVIGTSTVREKIIGNLQNFDIAVTSYSTLVRDIAKYEGITFRYHLIDEAQYIKNHNTQMAHAVKGIHSELRLAMTGTPVENSLAELWSIFDFIMPGYLFDYTHFKKHFETPIVSKKDENAVKALQKNVSPFILRRLKKDVLTELPDKTETVLASQMEDEQRKIYDANVMQVKQSLHESNADAPQDRIKILAMLTRLRQICCDPSLIYENYTSGSAKLEQCMELVQTGVASGHKILLFSQFTSMLSRIADRFDKENITYYTLTGSTKAQERIRLVNAFNEDDTNVFLISLKAGGTGLNLTGADIVIHFDPWWNLSAEMQASDRAYRIGQVKNVQVYKLIADRSIEQSILKLQQSKADLSDIATGGDGDITHMSTDEILNLLK